MKSEIRDDFLGQILALKSVPQTGPPETDFAGRGGPKNGPESVPKTDAGGGRKTTRDQCQKSARVVPKKRQGSVSRHGGGEKALDSASPHPPCNEPYGLEPQWGRRRGH